MHLACDLPSGGADEALRRAFHGRPLRHTESTGARTSRAPPAPIRSRPRASAHGRVRAPARRPLGLAAPAPRPSRRTAGAARRTRSRTPRTTPSRARGRRRRRSASARRAARASPRSRPPCPAATPASTTRARRLACRARTSAAAAKNAADHDECPLGNDGPSASATGLNDGRTRSARCLIVVVMSPLPATTTSRNGMIQRLRVRIVSTIPRATASTMIDLGCPMFVMRSSTSFVNGVRVLGAPLAPRSRRARSRPGSLRRRTRARQGRARRRRARRARATAPGRSPPRGRGAAREPAARGSGACGSARGQRRASERDGDAGNRGCED